MCGAFSIRIYPWHINVLFDIEPAKPWQPIYNARPGEWLPIVTEEKPKELTTAFWGFVPHWAKDGKAKAVINARAEGIATKPYFRSAFRSTRCVIPADGFYEWVTKNGLKMPYYFERKDKKPFAFAGLYSHLPKTEDKLGFTIITTEPNALVGKVHDRMPVILNDVNVMNWLDPDVEEKQALEWLKPYEASKMHAYPVSRKVNYAKEKGEEVTKAVGEEL